jgi:60S ribosome subunit biogenesis protein NIP7
MKVFFTKLSNYIGRNVTLLIDRQDEPWVFRVSGSRVYYLAERLLRFAAVVGKKELVSVGVCFGKFSKSKKFKLHVTALPVLAQYAKFKVWIKPSSEMSFL